MLTKQWYVGCDAEGCTEELATEPGLDFSQARKEAAMEGWRHALGKDFCPDHNGDMVDLVDDFHREKEAELGMAFTDTSRQRLGFCKFRRP